LYGHENELTQTLGAQVFESMSLKITQEKRTLKYSKEPTTTPPYTTINRNVQTHFIFCPPDGDEAVKIWLALGIQIAIFQRIEPTRPQVWQFLAAECLPVPELTRSAGIQLNERVSLRRHG
jgi:hypothetical protein